MSACALRFTSSLHSVTHVLQHVRCEVAQLLAFSVVHYLKAGHLQRIQLAASSAKASGAKRTCVLLLGSGRYGGSCAQEYDWRITGRSCKYVRPWSDRTRGKLSNQNTVCM